MKMKSRSIFVSKSIPNCLSLFDSYLQNRSAVLVESRIADPQPSSSPARFKFPKNIHCKVNLRQSTKLILLNRLSDSERHAL